MRLASAFWAIGSFVAAAFAGPAVAAGDAKRVALVIGNATYKESPLRNPVNDARAMATTLRQIGFQVIARENATKQQMERAVAEFGLALTQGTVALFYYAGHAMQVGGKNYLVPVDAQIAAERAVRLETLDLELVLDQVAGTGSDVNLMILDACRNNPFERRFRSQAGGLAQINAPKGTLIAYATAPGSVAADGTGANGLYTSKLVEAITAPGVPIEEVFKMVRVEVSRETNDAQTPWEASSLVGTFYFTAPTTVVVNPPVDREAMHWQSVVDSNDAAQLQTYLDQYPTGAFAGLAKAKLAALQRSMPAAAASAGVARFDGVYQGEYNCARSEDTNLPEGVRVPWATTDTRFVIKQGQIIGTRRWKQLVTGRVGSDSLTGVVAEDGKLTMVGKGVFDDAKDGYGMRFSGRIVDGRMTGDGRHAARACTLDFVRSALRE